MNTTLLEPVHDLFMVPARQQRAAIEARAAGHAGGLDKARNEECGFLLPCPKGCPAKAVSGSVAHPRRATSPAVVCALHLPPWRGNGHYEKIVNRLLRLQRTHCTRSGGDRGFSMVELLVTVAVLSVLTAIAAPSFASLIEGWRVRQATESLEATLYYARSESIKRGGRVAIQKLPNNTNGCTTAGTATQWGCGWIVCEDLNSNGKCTSAEPVLQRVDTLGDVQVTRTGGSDSIKMNRWGLVDGTWLGFSIVPVKKTITHPGARGLCMSSGGRIRTIPAEEIPCTG